ncbi:uncharacterized protein LOC135210844 [Macrobrachium nipponense]|uniref:uncharacterized protein LOC135210844 n=1 Tax=Macrobrachium nipponense TaxID=159736 RepID=UPI0030C7C256
MAPFDTQEFLAAPSIQVLSETTLTKAQWSALAVACGCHVSSSMIKAQIKCIAMQALIDSGRITDDDELELAQELLNVAQADLINKQVEKKEKSDAELELRRIEAEESLIKLKIQAERERIQAEKDRIDRGKQERREREEEKVAEDERQRIKEEREIARHEREMELIRARSTLPATPSNPNHGNQDPAFDVVRVQKLIPKFTEEAPDEFFDHFENVASGMGWPEDKWSVLLQSVLIGKGRSAYLALTADQCKDYKVLKHNVLQVYQLTPEYYNERFRNLRKDEKVTFLDYAYKVRRCF